jgi:hypothetical protein
MNTSHNAYEELVESGALGEMQREALAAVWALQKNLGRGATGREVDDFLAGQSGHKRLSELAKAGCIVSAGLKLCTITGRMVESWVVRGTAVEKPKQLSLLERMRVIHGGKL